MASVNAMYQERSQSTEQDRTIVEILRGMGVKDYDDEVIPALIEYVKRFSSEILCDAKDNATAALKEEIDGGDIRVALMNSEKRIHGAEEHYREVEEAAKRINARSLESLLEGNSTSTVLLHCPSDGLLQRSFTFVPGVEAYEQYAKDPTSLATLVNNSSGGVAGTATSSTAMDIN